MVTQQDQLAWRIVGSSVVGTSHTQLGKGCDDAHAFLQHTDGSVVLAVADGAGSAAHAAEGAEQAVHLALQASDTLLRDGEVPNSLPGWSILLQKLLQQVRSGLEAVALNEIMKLGKSVAIDMVHSDAAANIESGDVDAPPSELSLPRVLRQFDCTLLVALMADDALAIVQIGDGTVVVRTTTGELRALTRPDHGEYINGTFFITEQDYLEHAQYVVVPLHEVDGIALLTDGLERQALESYASNAPYEPFFAPLFSFASQLDPSLRDLEQELSAFLASARVCASTDDDKTLVVAVRRPTPSATPIAGEDSPHPPEQKRRGLLYRKLVDWLR